MESEHLLKFIDILEMSLELIRYDIDDTLDWNYLMIARGYIFVLFFVIFLLTRSGI